MSQVRDESGNNLPAEKGGKDKKEKEDRDGTSARRITAALRREMRGMILARAPIYIYIYIFGLNPIRGEGPWISFFFLLVELRGAALPISLVDF